MEEHLVKDHEATLKLTHRFALQTKRLTSDDIRYVANGMRHHMLETHVVAFESKFGELQLVSQQTRKTSQCIGAIIKRMNERDYV
jgi:hypothetical protein